MNFKIERQKKIKIEESTYKHEKMVEDVNIVVWS